MSVCNICAQLVTGVKRIENQLRNILEKLDIQLNNNADDADGKRICDKCDVDVRNRYLLKIQEESKREMLQMQLENEQLRNMINQMRQNIIKIPNTLDGEETNVSMKLVHTKNATTEEVLLPQGFVRLELSAEQNLNEYSLPANSLPLLPHEKPAQNMVEIKTEPDDDMTLLNEINYQTVLQNIHTDVTVAETFCKKENIEEFSAVAVTTNANDLEADRGPGHAVSLQSELHLSQNLITISSIQQSDYQTHCNQTNMKNYSNILQAKAQETLCKEAENVEQAVDVPTIHDETNCAVKPLYQMPYKKFNNMYICIICKEQRKFQTSNHYSIIRHINKEHYAKNNLKYCKKVLTSKRLLQLVHQRKVGCEQQHIDKKEFVCRLCSPLADKQPYSAKNRWQLYRHIDKVHFGKYKCTDCNRSFGSKYNLARHKKQKVPCTDASYPANKRYSVKDGSKSKINSQKDCAESTLKCICQQDGVCTVHQPIRQQLGEGDKATSDHETATADNRSAISEGNKPLINSTEYNAAMAENMLNLSNRPVTVSSSIIAAKTFHIDSINCSASSSTTSESDLKCQNCGKFFSKKFNLKRHEKKCTRVKKIILNQNIGDAANDYTNIKDSKKTDNKLITRGSSNLCSLNSSTTSESDLKCQNCGKFFSKKFNLKRHKKNCIYVKIFNNQNLDDAAEPAILTKANGYTIIKDSKKLYIVSPNHKGEKNVINASSQNHSLTAATDLNYKCPDCNRVFDRIHHLRRHQKTCILAQTHPASDPNHVSEENQNQTECHSVSSSHSAEPDKIEYAIPENDKLDYKLFFNEVNGSYHCLKCPKIYNGWSASIYHHITSSHMGIKYACAFCSTTYWNIPDWCNHYIKEHSGIELPDINTVLKFIAATKEEQ